MNDVSTTIRHKSPHWAASVFVVTLESFLLHGNAMYVSRDRLHFQQQLVLKDDDSGIARD